MFVRVKHMKRKQVMIGFFFIDTAYFEFNCYGNSKKNRYKKRKRNNKYWK